MIPLPDKDLGSLIAGAGGQVTSIKEITKLKSPQQRKACYKLSFSDGRQFKARLFASVEKRNRFSVLSPCLAGLPFSRAVAAKGRAILEEWVEGNPLEAKEVTYRQACSLGNLLGRLHLQSDLPVQTGLSVADEHLDRIMQSLSAISSHAPDKLPLCKNLANIARRQKPPHFETGLIHADFCAENMVVTESGKIVIVDNEHLRLDALDYDLARCWSRWPMDRDQREGFCAGYQQNRNMDSFWKHQVFWAIKALTLSVKVQFSHGNTNAKALQALDHIAQNQFGEIWPV